MATKEVGHNFLARLGKTKLRPGGIEATQWLLAEPQFNQETQILEVACNMGTTMISLAKKYDCSIIGLDQSPQALEKARKNIAKEHLEDRLTLVQGNALKLPFNDESFDVVINEAMLTMLVGKAKEKAIAEYYRVLKTNGVLLTHDVCILKPEDQTSLVAGLSDTINARVEPLTLDGWKSIFEQNGFSVKQKSGQMSLMDPMGMIRDEGFGGAFKIVKNGLKKENKEQFKKMFQFFKENSDTIGYVANISRKKG